MKPPGDYPSRAEQVTRRSIADRHRIEGGYRPPSFIRPQTSLSGVVDDSALAEFSLSLAESLRQDSYVDRAGAKKAGLLLTQLDIVKPPANLCETWVGNEPPRGLQGTISVPCQVGDVSERRRLGGIGSADGSRSDNHRVGFSERCDAVDDSPASRWCITRRIEKIPHCQGIVDWYRREVRASADLRLDKRACPSGASAEATPFG
jgi:hypothetical protein